jgi:hypothetical protein
MCPAVSWSSRVILESAQVFIITEAVMGKRKICRIRTGIIIMYSRVIDGTIQPP